LRRKLVGERAKTRRQRAQPPKFGLATSKNRKVDHAPASGRLAAAIATNCAIRRLIRDGVERKYERTRSIEISSRAGGSAAPKTMAQNGKWPLGRPTSRCGRK
jgi:hypothetical protein